MDVWLWEEPLKAEGLGVGLAEGEKRSGQTDRRLGSTREAESAPVLDLLASGSGHVESSRRHMFGWKDCTVGQARPLVNDTCYKF